MHKDGEKIGNVIGNRTTFSELRCREVINIQDGARLGQVSDLEIDLCTGTVMGLMVPGERRGLGLLRNREGLCIPFARIKKYERKEFSRFISDEVDGNLLKYLDSLFSRGFYNIIDASFIWDLTKNGYNFWAKMEGEWYEIIRHT